MVGFRGAWNRLAGTFVGDGEVRPNDSLGHFGKNSG